MSTWLTIMIATPLVAAANPGSAVPRKLPVEPASVRTTTLQLASRNVAPPPPVEKPPAPAELLADLPPVIPNVPAATPIGVTPAVSSGGYESAGCTSVGNYVGELYDQAYGGCPVGGGCPSCYGWSGKEDGCLCKLHSTCDLYPHFAYYPRYHGYYYFRPYNYQMIAAHQQFAACIGLDPRMPYSLAVFDRVYAGFVEKYPPHHGPIGSAMSQGSGLPQLEALLAEGDAAGSPLPLTPPAPQP